MPSFKLIELPNYDSLESKSNELVEKTLTYIFSFYETLKEQALAGNETAILLREHVRNTSEDGDKSIMRKIHDYQKIIKNLSSIDKFIDLNVELEKLPKLARAYIRRFNSEIAIEGSGIAPIPVKSEEEIATPPRRGRTRNEDIVISYYPSGYEALDKFRKSSRPIHLRPNDLTAEDNEEAMNAVKKIFEGIDKFMNSNQAPSYVASDLLSADLYDIVRRQDKVRRALINDSMSEEDQVNLSREFHYNKVMISRLR